MSQEASPLQPDNGLVKLAAMLGLAVVAVVSTSACGGASQTYSSEETKTAFAREGLVLVVPDEARFRYVPEGVALPSSLLVPESDESFLVFVARDSDAEAAWPDYERQQDDDSFDARRANVVVVSDDGPPAPTRKRILAALAALPDRGSPVEIAGD